MKPPSGVPSISRRLANALVGWSLAWSAAVTGAVWLAAGSEVDELLDDTLQSSAELLGTLVAGRAGLQADIAASAPMGAAAAVGGRDERFAWQVVGTDGRLERHSSLAPAVPWHATPAAGFSNAPAWRLYGLPLGADGRMLYTAQAQAERGEARFEVILKAVLAALAVGLLGHVWLRSRVREELAPLQALSDRLAGIDASGPAAPLGHAERQELEPVHAAIDELTGRLAQRIANERAFAAHAAHALRTPLAGIDAQLAVALRESPPELQPRLRRVREAAGRLQRVVSALLGLFRTDAAPRRQPVDLEALLGRLPIDGLDVQVAPGTTVRADADLLAAALSNLLDNAQRHGARHVVVSMAPRTGQQWLHLQDDGRGVDGERRQALQAAIDAQAYEGVTGLGLLLADRVARAHGGGLKLPATEAGFAVEIGLGHEAG